MLKTDIAVEIDLDELVDIHRDIPCEGIRFMHPNGEPFQESCNNPAKWTRRGHCSKDAEFCSPCKEEVSELARHGWCRCQECSVILWPEQLLWIRL